MCVCVRVCMCSCVCVFVYMQLCAVQVCLVLVGFGALTHIIEHATHFACADLPASCIVTMLRGALLRAARAASAVSSAAAK